MTAAERQRLARILGMLGSEHAGERASAGLQAEAFRKRHGLTWEEMLALPPVETIKVTPRPKPAPTPESPAWTAPPPPPSAPKEADRPADYADAWYANVRAKETARKAAGPPPYEPSTWTPSPPLGPWKPRPDIIGRWTVIMFWGVCAFVILCAFMDPQVHR